MRRLSCYGAVSRQFVLRSDVFRNPSSQGYRAEPRLAVNLVERLLDIRPFSTEVSASASVSVPATSSATSSVTQDKLASNIHQAVHGKRIDQAFIGYKGLLDCTSSSQARGRVLGPDALKALMTYCCKQEYVEIALAVFEDALSTAGGLDVEMAEDILGLFARKGRGHEAVTLLHRMTQHDVYVSIKAVTPLVQAVVPSRDANRIRTMIATLHEILPYFRVDDPIMYSTIISELLKVAWHPVVLWSLRYQDAACCAVVRLQLRPPAAEAASDFVLELDNIRKSREFEFATTDEGARISRVGGFDL
jgi:hypothetical protein